MTDWTLSYEGFEPAQEGLREALCTLGNGYFAARGAAEEAEADDTHYPGTYLAGGYNRLATEVAGRVIENEDLVNLPNWLPLTFRPEGGDWLNLLAVEVLSYRQELDLKQGVLKRAMRLRDRTGRETTLESRRLVHMGAPHLAAIEWTLTPENWSGRVEVLSALDGRVINAGVPRYRQLNGKHLVPLASREIGEDGVLFLAETSQSHIRIAEAARTQVFQDGEGLAVERRFVTEEGYVAHALSFPVAEGTPVTIEKVVALHTSRDRAISSPALAAEETLREAGRFGTLLEDHARAWSHLWRRCDLTLEGRHRTQMILRLHVFHLLQTVSPHSVDLDVGVPARGLHGEAYRGHIFWDELFIFRVLNLRAPRVARELLRYRHRRLPAARRLAAEAGFAGAMYPWQSGSDGREETQKLHLNPRSGRWLPDVSHRQRHVGLAIAYNIWGYFCATDDTEFMIEAGTEMMVEIARFFASLATADETTGRFHINAVMGPDEFHTAYPGADPACAGGINDNAYTNVLCAWVLARTIDALENLPPSRRDRLSRQLDLAAEEVDGWQEIAEGLAVPTLPNGLLAQFDGFGNLRELDWDAYRQKYGDIHRLDRLLEAEGEEINAYQVAKQADVLMLPFLFSAEALVEIFEQLGLTFDPADIPRMVAYYDARTSHGSTLSTIVDAWVVARTDRARSWQLFEAALTADLEDVQGGTTPEGIHLGAMCGTIDMVQNGYLGCEVRGDALHIDPVLPEALSMIATRLRYRGQDVTIEATREMVRVTAGGGSAPTIVLIYRGHQRRLPPGGTAHFRLVRPRRERAEQVERIKAEGTPEPG